MDEKKCVKHNVLGDCIEWITVGDKKVLQFQEEAKKCNPSFLNEWRRLTQEKKIKVMTED